MTPTRFRECLALLRWSQRGLADCIERDEGTVRMMARGKRDIPPDLAEWLERAADFMSSNPPPVWQDRRMAEVTA